MQRWSVILILVLAFLGLSDSLYLAQHAENGTPLICNVQSLSDCNTVATSQYSRIFGIPMAEFGVLFYSILFVLAALELVLYDTLLRRVLQGLGLIGLLVSLYSTFVQIFFIRALCAYCLASALFAVFIFILATRIEPIRKRIEPLPEPALEPSRLPMPPVV